MSLVKLTVNEIEVVSTCIRCVAEGRYVKHDFEFHTLTGLTVEEFLSFYENWPDVDERDDKVLMAINSAFRELSSVLGFPSYRKRFETEFGVSQDELNSVFTKWRSSLKTLDFE